MFNKNSHWWSRKRVSYTIDGFLNRKHPVYLEISRKIGRPVFIINKLYSEGYENGYWFADIDEECPVLADLGMPKYVSPQQMYQEISYFIGNTMNESPDIKPPVEISNKYNV